MSEKFKYAPGKPGFGTKGDRGEDGTQGLSMYFTDLNPALERYNIEVKIQNNQVLWKNSYDNLPDGRVYVTGDLFFDSEGQAYEIDAEENTFEYKFASLNMSGFFLPLGISSSEGFQRYFNSNASPKYIIDNVYTVSGAIDYTDVPENIYGIQPKDFTRIEYTNIKPEEDYNAFTVYSSGESIPGDNHKALAIVYDEDTKTFRFGNLDTYNNLRNTNLTFDVSLLQHTKELGKNTFNASTAEGAILTNYEIAANSLFNPNFESAPTSFYGTLDPTTCIVYWNLEDFVNDSNVDADLYFYQYIEGGYNGKSFNFINDVSTRPLIFTNIDTDGSIEITDISDENIYQFYIKFHKNGWSRNSYTQSLYKGVIDVFPPQYNLDSSDAVYSVGFDVSANFTWEASIYENPDDFIEIILTTIEEDYDGSIYISVTENTSTNARLGKARVHLLPGEAIYKDISIYQPRGKVGPEIFLYSPPPDGTTNFTDYTWPIYSIDVSQNATFKGLTDLSINVSASRSWNMSSIPDWAYIDISSNTSGDTDVSITFLKNLSLKERSASFIFDCSVEGEVDASTELSVTQEPVEVWFEYEDADNGPTRMEFPMSLVYIKSTNNMSVNVVGRVVGPSFKFSMHFSDDDPALSWVWNDFDEFCIQFFGRSGSGTVVNPSSNISLVCLNTTEDYASCNINGEWYSNMYIFARYYTEGGLNPPHGGL